MPLKPDRGTVYPKGGTVYEHVGVLDHLLVNLGLDKTVSCSIL